MKWSAPLLCLFSASLAPAQDMPLQTILVAGEGWKPAELALLPALPKSPSTPFKFPLEKPGIYTLRPDIGSVIVADDAGCHLWIFRIEKDNSLTGGEPYCALDVRRGQSKLAVTAMTTDRLNRMYAATETGLQIFDPTGRLCGVTANPSKEPITRLEFVGDRKDTLIALAGNNAFARKIKTEPPAPKKK